MTEIVTSARSSSNVIRTHGFPVLEAGNVSFPDGRYFVRFQPGRDRASFVLTHRVECCPLLNRLLENGHARYVCAVSSPMSSYRKIHVSDDPTQTIAWSVDDLGEPPLFSPMILSTVSHELALNSRRDGVHGIWNRKRVSLEKGSRLAIGHVVHLKSSILHLLSFVQNPDLDGGTFLVKAQEEPFRFLVNLGPNLHAALRRKGGDPNRGNIMTHVVTACLALLQREYFKDSEEEGGWRSIRPLLAFAEHLRSKGQPHWSDDGFRPEQVATALYPHSISLNREEDDE